MIWKTIRILNSELKKEKKKKMVAEFENERKNIKVKLRYNVESKNIWHLIALASFGSFRLKDPLCKLNRDSFPRFVYVCIEYFSDHVPWGAVLSSRYAVRMKGSFNSKRTPARRAKESTSFFIWKAISYL